MRKIVKIKVKIAVCPKCGNDTFKWVHGRRPSKLKEFDNGYPFEAYVCSKCGWINIPFTNYKALDVVLTSLMRGEDLTEKFIFRDEEFAETPNLFKPEKPPHRKRIRRGKRILVYPDLKEGEKSG